MLINQKAKGKIPEDNQEFLLEMKTNGLQSRGMMVRQVVVVVCSSSNNGEKVDICSSKNELSSKKIFFLVFLSGSFLFFLLSLFWRCSHLLLLFFENGFFQTDDWAQFCLVCFIFVFIQSSSARQDNIVLIFQQYQAKWGFVFKRECASQILRHRAAGHFCLSSEVDGIAHNKTVITILQRLLFMNGFMQQQ